MNIIEIIEKKRDGHELSQEEIKYFIEELTAGSIEDYQSSALLMAMYIHGLSHEEIVALTKAMMYSGDVVDLSHIPGIKADKHSTGGVGDKTTLVLAPIVASFGIPMAKMSGRGLGHTGGTVDKLESIPGFMTEISSEKFYQQVKDIHISVMGQTKNIAPADKKLYALRDVTATVNAMGLIACSIMSKKLASGSDAILLDVKVGSGAFLEEAKDAIELAKIMVEIGRSMNKQTRAVITNMDEPLGYKIGNALEVEEAMDTLQGKGPEDLTNLCIYLAAQLLVMTNAVKDLEEGISKAAQQLYNGKAFAKFEEFVRAQGATSLELPKATDSFEILAVEEGYVSKLNNKQIGESAALLGAGRMKMSDVIDPTAGIDFRVKIGDFVQKGDLIATLYTTHHVSKFEEAKEKILSAITFSEKSVKKEKLIKYVVY